MRWRNESGFCPIFVIIGVGLSGLLSACARTDARTRDTLAQVGTAQQSGALREAGAERASGSSEHAPRTSGVTPLGATPAPKQLTAAQAPGAPSRSTVAQSCVVPSPAEAPPPALPAASCPADPTGPPELAWGAVTFVDAPSSPRIRIELADTDPTRARGLMYRTALEQDQGMLFVFPDQERRAFWMKNTCIPLDMLFVDRDGTIVGILENVPTLNRASRGVRCPAAYVLEVNAGWTREHGVFAGQHLEIER